MKENLVSVIMAVYNSSSYLKEAINSVIQQSYPYWELIIIEDNSDDNSLEIIKEFSHSDTRIKYLENDINLGAGLSRNRGIEHAKGEFITFLDSDDLWSNKKLEIHINFMIKHDASFSHCSYEYIDEKGNSLNKKLTVSSNPVTYTDLLKRTEISCLTAIFNARKIGKYFMSDHRVKQDYALWLKILRDGHLSIPLEKSLAYYRQRKDSNTSIKYKLILKHIFFLRQTQNFSYIRAIYYTWFWIYNGIKRHIL